MNLVSSETAGSTSKSLLRRAQQRDPDAWQRLSRVYVPLVYGWARQAGLQSVDASDVGQEVFRTVALRIDAFRREDDGASFRGWLWGITRNKLREHARRKASGPQATGGSAAHQQLQEMGELPEQESLQFQQTDPKSNLLNRALTTIQAEFEPRTWQAFWSATVDQHATTQIADDLGMTTKAVRQAKYRVLRRLREEMTDLL